MQTIIRFNVGAILALLTLACVGSTGCGDAPVTQDGRRTSPLWSMVPGIGGTGDTLIGLFDLGQYRLSWVADSAGDTASSISTIVIAGFLDTLSYEFVMAGTCTVNGMSIAQADISDSYWQDSVPYVADGSMNTFLVSGSTTISAFGDSLSSPTSATAISSPMTGDTITRGGDVTIHWNSGGADTVRIYVMGTDTNGVNARRLDFTVPNNGAYTIQGSDVSGFAAGQDLAIAVARVNYKKIAKTNARQYLILVHSDHMIFCPLVN